MSNTEQTPVQQTPAQQTPVEPTPVEPTPNNQHYIDAINDLKANSVSKERYQKLEEENRNLLDTLVNGGQITAVTPKEQAPLENLVKEMREGKLSDIEFVEKALEFRERVLEEQGVDCFVSRGHNITPNEESYKSAQRTADTFKECLEYANGDNEVFINELQRRMLDNPIANIKNKNRR
jgi:hypothetical protein